MTIRVNLAESSYDIQIENNAIDRCGNLFDKYNKVFIVTDSGVPKEYSERVAKSANGKAVVFVMKRGEENKNFVTLMNICNDMLTNGLTRKDCVCAVGGGVVGDITAFAASIYMRGIDFYNFPTTLLSMVDSSSGGKTGIDFGNVKNVIGTFYQPKKVIIDPSVLKTLSERQVRCGLAEALKMAATFDSKLFDFMSKGGFTDGEMQHIIERSVELKKSIVEKDVKEKSIRKSLNFGHTIGHGIEVAGKESRYHGECVAIGMVAMSSGEARSRIIKTLSKLGLPTDADFDTEKVMGAIVHDKKSTGNGKISSVIVDRIGEYKIEDLTVEELTKRLNSIKR